MVSLATSNPSSTILTPLSFIYSIILICFFILSDQSSQPLSNTMSASVEKVYESDLDDYIVSFEAYDKL